jgi:GNAT superfamily N-acetyltransferase
MVAGASVPDVGGVTGCILREAWPRDIESLARIWHEGWHHAHAAILPLALCRLRTLESFDERLRALLAQTRVAEVAGRPVGFCIVKTDELYQLYVGASAGGAGVGAVLLADAEARMARAGVEFAWLACAIGNQRAEQFYAKRGWQRDGPVLIQADTSEGDFPLEVWRYEKALASVGGVRRRPEQVPSRQT